MKIDKIHLVFDKTKNSLKIKNLLEKKIIISSLTTAKLIIVLGGDGFMLETIKKLYKFKKPFYGLNTGNYGFLMNKLSIQNFSKNLETAKYIKIHPLQMTVKTKNNQTKKSIAINEV
jgi:NAD+ kinase